MTSIRRGGIAGRKRRTQIEGQFIAYTREMIESPAFRTLSLQARKVLHRLELEHCAHGGAENGRLPCRYQDFEDYGCRRKGINHALIEVEALGFVKTITLGTRAYGDIRGKASTFLLNYLPRPDGPPTHDWKKIESIEMAKQLVEDAIQRHHDWLDAAPGSPRRRQSKIKSQGAKCPTSGGEVPPNVVPFQGCEVPPTGPGAKRHHLSISRGGTTR
jgi:hypothetical protein